MPVSDELFVWETSSTPNTSVTWHENSQPPDGGEFSGMGLIQRL